MAASSQGKVLIADSNNQCVQVRTNSLKHLRLFSEIIYENYLIFNIVFYFISFYFLTKSRFSPTTASSEVVSASGAGLRVSCSGRQVWPCTPTATSSSQTMTTNGSASFRARASLRWVLFISGTGSFSRFFPQNGNSRHVPGWAPVPLQLCRRSHWFLSSSQMVTLSHTSFANFSRVKRLTHAGFDFPSSAFLSSVKRVQVFGLKPLVSWVGSP